MVFITLHKVSSTSYFSSEVNSMNNPYQSHLTPEILLKALKDEQDAIMFYKILITMVSDAQDENLIKEIHNDEVKHFSQFFNLYKQMTGQNPQIPLPKQPRIHSYTDGVKKAILDELEAYEFYRDIYIANTSPEIRNIFFEALTDENEHAAKFNYMFTKSKT
jgi:rubrerythrin